MQRKTKSVIPEVEYIPLNPKDVKQSIEIPVKTISKESLITIEKPGPLIRAAEKKKKAAAKAKKSKSRKKTQKDTYTLIITEKPQAAEKIAAALGNQRKLNEQGVAYFEVIKDKKEIFIASAAGHLFGLAQNKEKKTKDWPNFDIEWQPNYLSKKGNWSKKYYQALAKLCKNASDFIIATDYDIEGEVIGLNIVRFIAKQKDAKRMKYSTLTKDELNKSYENLLPTLDWGQAIAGETRHYLDWFYGINLSRGLMEAIKKAGSFRIFSIGRVQGPALNLIVKKEKEIQAFKPETYWQVFITVQDIKLKYPKDIFDKKELDKFKELEGKEIQTQTQIKEQRLPPPTPFDLTTLQTEAYKFHGISPARTLQIAQQLYLSGFISYPRTSSQKIPDAVNPKEIIKKLSKSYPETSLCTRKLPIEGKKSDPAHPSIYPTGEYADLEGENRKIYELVIRRFLACFCQDAIIEDKTIIGIFEELRFVVKGIQIKEKNWLEVYKSKLVERELPDLNGKFIIGKVDIEEKQTLPPKRYTPASLVAELTRKNLGTKSTRAMIIETLYDRGYVKGQSIEATPLGIRLIDCLEKYSPVIIDEELTRNFEKEMDEIQELKTGLQEREDKIIDDAKSVISKIAKEFKKNEEEIGKELIEASTESRAIDAKERELQQCPVCKKNNLRILFNRKSKRYFAACSGYPDCKTTFTLPNGLVKRADKICEHCSWPKLLLIKAGKRPWEFCFNPACPGRQKENSSEQ